MCKWDQFLETEESEVSSQERLTAYIRSESKLILATRFRLRVTKKIMPMFLQLHGHAFLKILIMFKQIIQWCNLKKRHKLQ